MHEAGLMHSALDMAQTQALARGASRIHRLTLRVGAMSGVVPEALEFAFEALSPDTPAAGARLELHLVPVICFCAQCLQEFSPADIIYACPLCGQITSEVRQGTELELASLEVS